MCDRNDRVSGILQKISRLLAAAIVVVRAVGRSENPSVPVVIRWA